MKKNIYGNIEDLVRVREARKIGQQNTTSLPQHVNQQMEWNVGQWDLNSLEPCVSSVVDFLLLFAPFGSHLSVGDVFHKTLFCYVERFM